MNIHSIKILILCALLIGGCTSFSYYSPEKIHDTKAYGGACTDPIIVYSEDMIGKAKLHASARPVSGKVSIKIRIIVEEGSSVQFTNDRVLVKLVENNSVIKGKIIQFSSGIAAYGMETQALSATTPLRGEGRYKNLPEPYGPKDTYSAVLNLDFPIVSRFTFFLPELLVDGQSVTIDPIAFSYKKGRRMQCLQ